jgi:putative adhesin
VPRTFLLALLAGVVLAGFPARATADTERVTRTLPIVAGGTLRLNNFSGRVTITGTSASEVTIDATRHGSRSQLERVTLDITSDRSQVRIDANQRDRSAFWGWGFWGRDDAVETDLDIKVPRHVNLDITLFSSALSVSGVDGSHLIETFSSRVALDNVSGSIRGKSFSGPFEIRTASWSDAHRLEFETFSGSVDLHVPDSTQGTVEFDSFSGRFTSAFPVTFQSSRRKHFVGQLGSGSPAGSVRVKTFSGNLSINQ